MNVIKHISFDLDGTLVDSTDVMRAAWSATAKNLGISCGFESFQQLIGLPFEIILSKLGLSTYSEEFFQLYFDRTKKLQKKIQKIEGVDALIRDCRNLGLGLSIITSKPRCSAESLINALDLDIDFLITPDDVHEGKPSSKSMQVLIDQFALSSKEIVYIGDMIHDLQFALNSRVPFIFFKNKGKNALPLNLRNPIISIDLLSEVIPIIEGM